MFGMITFGKGEITSDKQAQPLLKEAQKTALQSIDQQLAAPEKQQTENCE